MGKSNIKVSVTVPVYNTSKYLRKCLDSLRDQTIDDIEFILVDDGSTDGSGDICDEYSIKDKRFRVIHQNNAGSAVARQIGLENAGGEYIIVCDSDDWAEPCMYKKMYEIAKTTNADIVCCDYFMEYNDGRSIPISKKFKISHDNIIDNIDYTYYGAGNSWVQLIKRSLFFNNHITYEPGINLGEDALITLKLMKLNPKVIKLDSNLYHYRRLFGENTYTNNIRNDQIQQLYYKYNWIKNNYVSEEYNEMIFAYALSIVFSSIRVTDSIDIKQFNTFISTELTWRKIISNKKSLKSLVVVLSKLLPYSFVRNILKKLYPLFYK